MARSSSMVHQGLAEARHGNFLLLVTFRIGAQRYGLPVDTVLEVVRLPALVTLAGAPPAICGMLNLRGRFIPVLSGHELVGETPAYTLSSQIVIAGEKGPELGVLVDQVEDVYSLRAEQLVPLREGTIAPFLEGVIEADEGAVVQLNLSALRSLIPTAVTAQVHHAEEV